MLSKQFEQYDESEGWLNLANCQLSSIPAEVWNLRGLTCLSLDNNDLSELDPRLWQLTALEALYLSHNKIREIPDGIGNLRQLREFSASGNSLRSLPESFCRLDKLTLLILAENNFEQLPESIGSLASLERFNCSKNSLAKIPDIMSQLWKLVELNLSNNRLAMFPTALLKLPNLSEILLSNNQISNVPPEVNQLLPHRHSLWLDNNPIPVEAIRRIRLKPGSCLTIDKRQNESVSEIARDTLNIEVRDGQEKFIFDRIKQTCNSADQPLDFGTLTPEFYQIGEVQMGSSYKDAKLKLVGDWVPNLPDFTWQDKWGESKDGRFLILIAWDRIGYDLGFRSVMIDKFDRKVRVSPRIEGACEEVRGFSLVVNHLAALSDYLGWEVLDS